ncbi:hypothetical protein, partial [Ectopseudomonas oleovorans]|uniref:hypothetical protein n=1 Tax=Ectopseudomonas oleovorans TaxID=301 RepID=UPI001C8B25E8
EPPGADPHAGWCGRGAVHQNCPLCRLGALFARNLVAALPAPAISRDNPPLLKILSLERL